jgi:hypothetical protein
MLDFTIFVDPAAFRLNIIKLDSQYKSVRNKNGSSEKLPSNLFGVGIFLLFIHLSTKLVRYSNMNFS